MALFLRFRHNPVVPIQRVLFWNFSRDKTASTKLTFADTIERNKNAERPPEQQEKMDRLTRGVINTIERFYRFFGWMYYYEAKNSGALLYEKASQASINPGFYSCMWFCFECFYMQLRCFRKNIIRIILCW